MQLSKGNKRDLARFKIRLLEKGRAVCLEHNFTPLDTAAIKAALPSSCQLHYLPLIDSTNNYLLNIAADAKTHIAVGEYQSHGRGKDGAWHSQIGSDLLFSIRLASFNYSALSLYLSLVLYDILNSLAVGDLSVKWPNDLLLKGRKLAGILVEQQQNMLVIGIGINLGATGGAFKTHLNQQRSMQGIYLQQYFSFDRQQLAALIIGTVLSKIRQFAKHSANENWQQSWLKRWQQLHAFKHKKVSLVDKRGAQHLGLCCGVNRHGALVLELANGKRKLFYSAHNLRKHEVTD